MFYKSKSEIRAETEKQLKLFLKKGGSIEVVKARKAPKQAACLVKLQNLDRLALLVLQLDSLARVAFNCCLARLFTV
jgi:hypothetical protein